MGSGRGVRYFPSNPERLHALIERARDTAEQQQLNAEVNKILQDLLASLNQRDKERVQEHLDEIGEILKDRAEIERFLFGGSVAKHTYVDGLSDIDALVILHQVDLAEKSAQSVLRSFHRALQDRLTHDSVESVERGRMAVTVTYRDGTQIQLLPAVRRGPVVRIPDAQGKGWNETRPKVFQRILTRANQRLGGTLVPAIKLTKSIISDFSKQKRLSGYHVEALAIAAVKGYRGPATCKALLMHVLDFASKRVMRPIGDVTGQSRAVDSYLGKSRSTQRRIAADALASVVRQLNAASSARRWKTIIEA